MIKKVVYFAIVITLIFINYSLGEQEENSTSPQGKPQEVIGTTPVKLTQQGETNMPALSKNPIVLMETSMGNIKIELYPDKAPITVKNFLDYVESGFYDGLIFHRVIDNFMIQGGGFTPDMKEKENKRPPIKNEAKNGLKNERGTIAMARTSVIDSATCQFFINVKDNPFLDHRDEGQGFGYAVFGKVIEGMDTVDKIKVVKTTTKGIHQNVPIENVIIKSVKVVK